MNEQKRRNDKNGNCEICLKNKRKIVGFYKNVKLVIFL